MSKMDSDISTDRHFAKVIRSIRTTIEANEFVPGAEHIVHLTHINSPHSFYVRLATLCHAETWLAKQGPPITFADLKVSINVVYKSKTHEKFVRGRISEIRRGNSDHQIKCIIFAIDFGNYDTDVYLKDIYLPDYAFESCTDLAVHCKLDSCNPIGVSFDEDAIHAMKYFAGKSTAKIIVINTTVNGQLVVILNCHKDYVNAAQAMAELRFTKTNSTPPGEQIEHVRNPLRYRHKKLNIGDILHVVVLEGETIHDFYAFEFEDIITYCDFDKWYAFNNHCIAQKPLTDLDAALDGRACGVKMTRPLRYERACVKKITVPKTEALVLFVDWGRMRKAHIADIKPVAEEYIRSPLALYCSAEEHQHVDYGVGLGKQSLSRGLDMGIEILELGIDYVLPHKVRLHHNRIFPSAKEEDLISIERLIN